MSSLDTAPQFMRTHTEAILEARQYFQSMILWSNPSHPTEEGQRLKQVVWKPKVDEHGPKGPEEELVSRNAV